MKKLALSVVLLMVAGAGGTVGAIGCSSSSSGTTADDSGTNADVTTGDDSGTTAMCDIDAAGSLQIGVDTDAGFVENTACEACIATNCGQAQCVCLTDTNMVTVDDAGEPGCGAYAGCVYTGFLTALATTDAGLAADLMGAQTACATGFASASTTSGNALIGCIASSCESSCVGQ